jgi:hypothetical protein
MKLKFDFEIFWQMYAIFTLATIGSVLLGTLTGKMGFLLVFHFPFIHFMTFYMYKEKYNSKT